MNERPLPASRAAARRSWRMILATALMAGVAWLATSAALRAGAQEATPSTTGPAAAPAPADDASAAENAAESNEAEEVARRAPAPRAADEEAPEFRESADNNISFPIDI